MPWGLHSKRPPESKPNAHAEDDIQDYIHPSCFSSHRLLSLIDTHYGSIDPVLIHQLCEVDRLR